MRDVRIGDTVEDTVFHINSGCTNIISIFKGVRLPVRARHRSDVKCNFFRVPPPAVKSGEFPGRLGPEARQAQSKQPQGVRLLPPRQQLKDKTSRKMKSTKSTTFKEESLGVPVQLLCNGVKVKLHYVSAAKTMNDGAIDNLEVFDVNSWPGDLGAENMRSGVVE